MEIVSIANGNVDVMLVWVCDNGCRNIILSVDIYR